MDKQEHLTALTDAKNALQRGDAERVAKQHSDGKCTARERIEKLLDAGSFVETGALRTDGNVVCGYGTVHDRPAYVFAQDHTCLGGAMTKTQSDKICALLSLAQKTGAPVIALVDSEGAKLEDGADALTAYAAVYHHMVRLSGVCPMLCAVMGPCRGVAALMAQVADIAVQVKKTSELALVSPLSVPCTGKNVDAQMLGGMDAMLQQGAVAMGAENEDSAIAALTALVDILPSCNAEDAPLVDSDDLNRVLSVCNEENGAALAAEIADNSQVIELSRAYGAGVHTMLCRVGGRSVGIVANDHSQDNGRMDAAACAKVARFVRFCDCYQITVISLINSEGFAMAVLDKQGEMMRAGAQMMYAYAEATTPKLAVITGSAIGAAYVAMGGKKVADVAYAWPGAVVSALPVDAAVQVLHEEELKQGKERADLESAYAQSVDGLYAAQHGVVDDVITPAETRKYLIAAMEMLASKHDVNLPKKHGNVPM